MRKLSGAPPLSLFLQARAVDELRVLQWMLCGAKEDSVPESVAVKMFSESETRKTGARKTARGYDSGADFDKAWKELTGNV